MGSHSRSAALHSAGGISAEDSVKGEQSQPQQHTWNGGLFVVFPAEAAAAHSLHFQHLCVDWGCGFGTPIVGEAFRWQYSYWHLGEHIIVGAVQCVSCCLVVMSVQCVFC